MEVRPPNMQGSYRQKKIVRVAPDAFIKIQGRVDLAQCSFCNKSFDINSYVTSINVDLNVDSCPGSATISLSIPRHDINNFYGDGHFLIQEMMEIEIFSKGYFYVYGIPQYYPIFWGIITQVSESYGSGEHTVSLSCADILKWWEKTRLNVTPSLMEAGMTRAGYLPLLGNVFAGANPYDILFSLSRNVTGDLFMGVRSLSSTTPDFYTEPGQKAIASIMSYWRERFKRMKGSLILYGMNGASIRSSELDVLATELENKMDAAKGTKALGPLRDQYKMLASNVLSKLTIKGTDKRFLDPTSPDIVGYKNMFTQAGQVNLWESEYLSKLEIANVVKDVIHFEFFMDVTGDIVFKPPFWNLDVSGNKPISVIRDMEVIDWNFSSSEADVYSILTLKGSFSSKSEHGISSDVVASSTVTDYKLLARYGVRATDDTCEWTNDPKALFFFGMDKLDYLNAHRNTGSITIPHRPELRLGFPVYVESRDEYWYLGGISHSISFGSRATTTLTLHQKRGKYIAPVELKPKTTEVSQQGSANNMGQSSNTPRDPKTGKIVGHPNVVMVWDRDSFSDTEWNNMTSTQQAKNSNFNAKSKEKAAVLHAEAIFFAVDNAKAEELESKLEYLHSFGNPGVGEYGYAQMPNKVTSVTIDSSLGAIDSQGKKVRTNANTKKGSPFKLIIPVSDEFGYEHIGNYPYGRGLTLSGGGIREIGSSVDLGVADVPDLTGITNVMKSHGSEGFVSMTPTKDADIEVTASNQTNTTGTQPVQSYTLSDTLIVEADTVSRGISLASMKPNKDSGQGNTNCACALSRLDLDLQKLVLERNPQATWVPGENTKIKDKDNIEDTLTTQIKKDFDFEAHTRYEEKLRTGEK
jgi:hypothetical protein